MNEILPALIGFIVPTAWLLIRLRWHIRVYSWYYHNVNDPYGLVLPSISIIISPFLVSFLLQNQGSVSILLSDVSGSPLAIIAASSLTATGILFVNLKIEDIKKSKSFIEASKIVISYLNNDEVKIKICIQNLQQIKTEEINEISDLSSKVAPSLAYFKLNTLEIEKNIIRAVIEKSSVFDSLIFTRISWYFTSISSLVDVLEHMEGLYRNHIDMAKILFDRASYDNEYSYDEALEEAANCESIYVNQFYDLLHYAYKKIISAHVYSIVIRMILYHENERESFLMSSMKEAFINDLISSYKMIEELNDNNILDLIKSELKLFGIAV